MGHFSAESIARLSENIDTKQLGVRHFSRFLRKPALSDSRRVACRTVRSLGSSSYTVEGFFFCGSQAVEGRAPRPSTYQQMNVLGYDHVTGHDELIALPHLLQHSQKKVTAARGAEQRLAPMTTASNEM